ncbi:gamma-glutamylputrescine oxidoreductase [Aspergillus ellipticus CBS 707.79]|uniref:Gamma-glutamylputrescine oxidoreductase n=1 Tax=Aspergillus ellipticus CBS 707.79 TaxID=1448320 RepID=A0A319D3I6_9EURO|nr:gamma-glutamylputrescine oxidoreductase [Aspergillus ellipticus CBS 707.79]
MSHSTQSMNTSGETDPVWVHLMPYSKYPQFPTLNRHVETDICVVGAGIAGISIAYELVDRGKRVTMIEAGNVLSGVTSRTGSHLSNYLEEGYVGIEENSHTWALRRIKEISRSLHIDCEFRMLPGYGISQYSRDDPNHEKEVAGLRKETEMAKTIRVPVSFREGLIIKGWDGSSDQRGGAIFANQATFHPTKKQPNFQCFTQTRMVSAEERVLVQVRTANGYTITAADVVKATCVPQQKLGVFAVMESMRTYCIAIRVRRGSIEDCLICNGAQDYKYVRLTECDEKNDYLVVGGYDHRVGQMNTSGRFEELEAWVRERFTHAGSVDYHWSGQVFGPVDFIGFIGRSQGKTHTYNVTGDGGNGLTHGVLAGCLIADEIQGKINPCASLYNTNRLSSVAKSMPWMWQHDAHVSAHYKRQVQSDMEGIEDVAAGSGEVMKEVPTDPIVVYKDDGGKAHRFSALCPHAKAVLSWNDTKKGWDRPVHDSPARSNLKPMDEYAKGERTQIV